MLTVDQANQLTQEWIEVNVDLDRARAVYKNYPRRQENQKLTRLDYVPEYEWMIDPVLGGVSVLVEVGVDGVEPGEGGWEYALRLPTTRQYVEWFKQGHEPPPIIVVQHRDGDLVSCNRRRWLAAREAGVKTLKAFYSPTTTNGRPKWELKPCTWDRSRICREYVRGGDCWSCAYYEKEQVDD